MTPPDDLRSRIEAVTVYRRGAMVTRRAELALAGERPRRVQLVGLPLALDDASVRVEVRGRGVVAGDLQITLAVPGRDRELAPPTNEALEAATLEVAQAQAEVAELERARARLDQLEPVARGRPEEGKAPQPSPTAARLELLAFRRQRAAALSEALAEAREGLRARTEALASLREQQRRASSARNVRANELRKAALIELHPEDGGEGKSEGELSASEAATIELHYFVPGARWAPSYTVRLDRSMREATLELRAMVGQSTGEDWSGVDLTLSTAHPQRWTELPELDSRRIGRRQPPPAKTGWRPPPVGAESLYADYDRELGQASEPVVEAPAPAKPKPPPPMPSAPPSSREQVMDGPPPPGAMPAAYGAAPAAPQTIAQQAMPKPESRSRSKRSAGAESDFDVDRWVEPMPAPMARKSAGLGGLVGSAIDGLASALSTEDSAAFELGGGGGPPGAALAAPMVEPELLAGRELLDYGRLRMFPAGNSRRGALRRISLRVHYEQTIRETLSLDLALEQISEAHDWAALLDTESPPEGHVWPRDEDGFDYAYVASAPVDVPSTGAFRSLAIDLREAEARPRYVSVPRETQDVFRIVRLKNPFDAPLLAGPIDVYVDGKFMLGSTVELTPAGAELELGIGVEQAIKIARNVKFNEDSSGMFKRQLELHHSLELEVQNNLSVAALVEIRERVPVVFEAMADDIHVELGAVEPSWEDYEPKRTGPELLGGRRWKIEVPANGKRELSASYVIRLPTSYELVGGNRRES